MKKNGFTTVELITSFVVASVVLILSFNIVLLIKDSYNKENTKTKILIDRNNLSYAINSSLQKDIRTITRCEIGDSCYLFTYEDNTTSRLYIDSSNKTVVFDNYRFDASLFTPAISIDESYDEMHSTLYNGYFTIHITLHYIEDYDIKAVKFINTNSTYINI